MSDVACVLDVGAKLGECPVWCDKTKRLYWIDIKSHLVHRFDPLSGDNETCQMALEVGSIGLRSNGELLAATRDGFMFLNFDTALTHPIIDPESHLPYNRFNDGRTDRNGRFLAGTMSDPFDAQNITGALYRLDTDLSCHLLLEGIGISNGLAFSPDGKVLYFADTPRQTIWAFDYDTDSGAISGHRVFATTHDYGGKPDGACVDEEGFYWSANVDGWQLLRFAPNGKLDRKVRLPIQKPSMCAFGGENLQTLFVTSIHTGSITDLAPNQAHAGGLFALEPGVRGLAEPLFRG